MNKQPFMAAVFLFAISVGMLAGFRLFDETPAEEPSDSDALSEVETLFDAWQDAVDLNTGSEWEAEPPAFFSSQVLSRRFREVFQVPVPALERRACLNPATGPPAFFS